MLFDVACDCFRREPSKDLDRLQSFRMREYVCIGTPEQIAEFRGRWMTRAQGLAEQLGLPYRIEQASEPFFGRGGKLMATSQIEQSLKFELLVPVRSAEQPTACMSFNYHRDHFGTAWGLRTEAGESSHTGCVAFGMDRLRWRCSPPTASTAALAGSGAQGADAVDPALAVTGAERKSDAEQRVLGVGEVAKARTQYRRGAAPIYADTTPAIGPLASTMTSGLPRSARKRPIGPAKRTKSAISRQ